jgi:hypothetical protein
MLTPIESTKAPAGRGDSAASDDFRMVPPPAVTGVDCMPPLEQFASPSASDSVTIAPKMLLAENRTNLPYS